MSVAGARPIFRNVKAGILLLVLLSAPLGVARAVEDSEYAGVQQRLDAMVQHGRITQAQAEQRWQAFLRNAESMSTGDAWRRAEVETELQAVIDAGEITQGEADLRLVTHGAYWKGYEQGRRDAASRRETSGIEARVEAAIAAGKITREQAELGLRQEHADERVRILRELLAEAAAESSH